MQNDPGTEWTRLTRLYAEKTDEDLFAPPRIFEIYRNRTAGLRDEMRKRKPRSQNPFDARRMIVAADRLDDARAILAQPVPQNFIDQSKFKVEDFFPPTA